MLIKQACLLALEVLILIHCVTDDLLALHMYLFLEDCVVISTEFSTCLQYSVICKCLMWSQ